MKSILMVATIPGTLSGFILPFAKHFAAKGWRVEGMARDISKCDRCVTEFDRVWDIQWSRNPLDIRNFLVAAPKVRAIVKQGNYDLVHVHTPVASFVTRYALRNLRQKQNVRVFYTAHGFHFHPQGNPLTNAIFRNLEKIAGNWTDYLITINRDDTESANKYRLLPSERIYYTPGIGVDTNYYNLDKISLTDIDRLKQELKLKPSDSLILCIAEFTPNKRHQDQLKALQKLDRADIHLAFAGDGAIKTEVENLTAQLGLRSQVHFLGFRSDIPALIRASNAVILTSQREGLPRSIMEALCLATPVIGTKIRGIKDLLADNCGLLVDVADIDALANAMAWIVDNPDKAIAMGQRGKAKITEYDVNNIVGIYNDLYERALSSN